MTQNDVMQLFIVPATPATDTPTQNPNAIIDQYTDLDDGEAAVVNSHNMVLSATSVLTDDIVAESGIKIIQRVGTDLIQSDLIKQANIVAVKAIADSAGAEQVSYIGYNATAGEITATSSKLYVVRISLKEQDVTGQGQAIILNSPYKSDASATQLEVALGLVEALSRTLRRQAVPPIQAELVCNVAYAATASFDGTVTFVKGDQYVTIGTNKQYNTGTELAVGDYVRFSDAPTTTGALTSDGIYKVIELTSTTVFKVDRPIEEESMTAVASAKAAATVLTAAKMASAYCGIKLSSVARTFNLGKGPYSKVSFTIGLDSVAAFGTTPVTYSTAMSLGAGTYQQIAQLEWDLLGNDGNPYPGDFMWSAARKLADSSTTYDQLSITYYGDHSTMGVGGTPRRMKQLCLAFGTGFTAADVADNIIDILAAYSTQSLSLIAV
jgi:hypothetical protein